MLHHHRILAVVLARGGSERLPGKNLRPLAGQPLLHWTFEAAANSKYLDQVIISSDSQDIIEYAREQKVDAPFIRPAELAGPTVTSDETLLHALKWQIEHEMQTYEYVVMLQPTSPLRTASDIDQAIELLASSPNALSVVSVTALPKNPAWLKRVTADGYLEPLLPSNTDQVFLPNGAVYVARVAEFLTQPQLYTSKTLPMVMPSNRSIDIDQIEEFELAEYYMKQQLSSDV
jgi:CMP-N-acetylneuraminic acid synthetase